MEKLHNAKIKLEAVLRYAEDALKEVNELIEEESLHDNSGEVERFPTHPDNPNSF